MESTHTHNLFKRVLCEAYCRLFDSIATFQGLNDLTVSFVRYLYNLQYSNTKSWNYSPKNRGIEFFWISDLEFEFYFISWLASSRAYYPWLVYLLPCVIIAFPATHSLIPSFVTSLLVLYVATTILSEKRRTASMKIWGRSLWSGLWDVIFSRWLVLH